MEDRVLAPAFVLLAAAVLAISSPSKAFAADPSGIWAKDDGSAKVEIKKCGRGLCGSVVWLRNPSDSRGKPLHDARNENASLRGRPIIGLPLFSNMRPTGPNSWAGNVYNPVEGRIYTDVKVTLVSSRQIVLRGCRSWLMCGEKTWTRSTLPPDATTPQLIEVKAPAEPGPSEKAEPNSLPQPEAPTIEASLEREQLSAPGFTLVSTSASQLPLSGDDVLSMAAMTGVSPAPATVAPSLTETAAAEEQWPWMQRRSARLASTRTVAQAQAAPAAPVLAKPKPRPFVLASQAQWPWQRRRSRAVAQAPAPAPAPAMPIAVMAKPKPVAREAQEQWPWAQRRAVVVATRTAGY
jgi:uncharacterized protein (DUF2147 family)